MPAANAYWNSGGSGGRPAVACAAVAVPAGLAHGPVNVTPPSRGRRFCSSAGATSTVTTARDLPWSDENLLSPRKCQIRCEHVLTACGLHKQHIRPVKGCGGRSTGCPGRPRSPPAAGHVLTPAEHASAPRIMIIPLREIPYGKAPGGGAHGSPPWPHRAAAPIAGIGRFWLSRR